MGKNTSSGTNNQQETSDVVNRLDAIIRLLMVTLSVNEKYSMRKIYSILQDSGLKTSDIGKIMSKPANYISAEIIKSKKMIEDA